MKESRTESRKKLREERKRLRTKSLRVAGTIVGLVLIGAVIAYGVTHFGNRHDSQSANPAVPGQTPGKPADTPGIHTPIPTAPAGAPTDSAKPSVSVAPSGSPAAGGDGKVRLSFVGDVIFASTVETVLKQNGYDYPYEFVRSDIENADIAVANLETPVTDRGTEQKNKEYTYQSTPDALPAFKEAGFDLVNLANNHSMDYGAEGLLDTIDRLDKAGIKHVGAGKDEDEAYRPAIVESHGIKIAFLGFSRVVPDNSWKAGKNHPGTTQTYDYRQPVEAIENAKKQADLVVVLAHWGVERKDRPESYQVDLAKRYIDAGADLVVGGHPHVLQGFETYKGKWIAYSLGNFLFTTNNYSDTWDTVILNATCTKGGQCEMSAVPVSNKWAKPTPLDAVQADALFKRLGGLSYHARVGSDGSITAAP